MKTREILYFKAVGCKIVISLTPMSTVGANMHLSPISANNDKFLSKTTSTLFIKN